MLLRNLLLNGSEYDGDMYKDTGIDLDVVLCFNEHVYVLFVEMQNNTDCLLEYKYNIVCLAQLHSNGLGYMCTGAQICILYSL
jgi:hypothetical protein